jgi:hypothetical protein
MITVSYIVAIVSKNLALARLAQTVIIVLFSKIPLAQNHP